MLWSKIIGAGGAGGVVEGWNVSTAVFNQSFSVAAQETAPSSVFFRPDGLKMYVVGKAGNDVNEYTLATAWDVSSALYSVTFYAALANVVHVFFKPNGLKMYISTQAGVIYEYDLSTAWDVSSSVFLQNFSVASQETVCLGFTLSPDGIKMYVSGFSSGGKVNEYTLATAWDVSSATHVQNFSTVGQDADPRGVVFKPDGRKMFFIGASGDDVNEYDLGTAWNISTAVFLQNFSVAAQETLPAGLFFKPDGLKMYVIGASGDDVNEYDLTA